MKIMGMEANKPNIEPAANAVAEPLVNTAAASDVQDTFGGVVPRAAQEAVADAAPQATHSDADQTYKAQRSRTVAGLSRVELFSVGALLVAGLLSVFLVLTNASGAVAGRAFLTFILFLFFVVATLTASRMTRMPLWFMPLSLGSNLYVLLAGSLHTWASAGTFAYSYSVVTISSLGYIMMLLFMVFISFWVNVLVLLFAQKPRNSGEVNLAYAAGWATVASVITATVMITVVPLYSVFGVEVTNLYWRIVVSLLVLAGMFLAVTAVLRFSARNKTSAGASRLYGQNVSQPVAQSAHPMPQPFPTPAWSGVQTPQQPQGNMPIAVSGQPVVGTATVSGPLLPWPTFADGTPLPAKADGQPDFSVPGAPVPPHLQG